ncbi:MAG: S8 family serine peptidase [Candidatus Gracilibacteria bacterium]|nr:S8 family serine peptidase [Candidatus Gracilibacteria bacterium]
MRLFIAGCAAILSTTICAKTVSTYLTSDYLDSINENNSLSIEEGNSSGYFQKHNIGELYKDNLYLYTPYFTTAVIDSGFYKDHEDIFNFINITTTREGSHGTGLLSLSFGSILNNNLGTLSLTNSFSNLELASNSAMDEKIENVNSSRIISSSVLLSKDTAYATLAEALTIEQEVEHISSFQLLRDEIELNPNNLYVFAAGNSHINAKWDNGAIHYKVNDTGDAVFDPLENVIVVGAMGYDDILHYYSDFGESVDVATISGVYAAKEVVDGVSTYYETSDDVDYGVRRTPDDSDNGDFHGTSAAQPITAGMAALLLSMDPSLTGAEIKDVLLHEQLTSKVTHRYTGKQNCVNSVCTPITEKLDRDIPVINLNDTYVILKKLFQKYADEDVLLLVDKKMTIDSDLSCKTLWENNITKRKVSISSDDKITDYTAYQYDDRCLFFRGNSVIIEYDSITQIAQSLYYGDDNYETYALFRKFTENLASAQSDSTWRNGYEVTLNSNGFVGCTTSDNCTDNIISTSSHCENLFEALTGTEVSTMNSTVRVPEDNVCLFEEGKTQLYYYAESGEILFEEKTVEIPPVGNFYLQDPSLSVYTVQQGKSIVARVEQWYTGDILDSNLGSVRVGYYLSTDTQLSNDDIYLEDDSSGLGSDDLMNNEAESLLIAETVTPGEYYILFVSDYQNNFVETDEGDNIKASPLTITERIKNDVYIQNVSVSNITETSLSVSARQYYQGNRSSNELGSIYLGYYLSTDRYLSNDDTRLATDPSSIGSNDSYDSELATLTLPSDLQNDQNYYILFVADYRKNIPETNENNNVEYVMFTHKSSGSEDNSQGDIYIKNPRVRENSNGTYTVSLSQYYSGNLTISLLENPDVAYVFSKDKSIQASQDTLLGMDSSSIGSDDLYDNESLTFSIPSNITVSGYYYLIVIVDARTEVSESDEKNNVAYIRFRVNL